ncbi:MAG TPA: ABC transporter ATP-binding protein [Acetobacteraceae bacterium]|nr:ABC transporter ATP-binding protein [Acetobacteraceae bacterium]
MARHRLKSNVQFASFKLELARRLLPYLWPIRYWIATAIIISLAAPPIGGALLWLVKETVDQVLVAGRFKVLPLLAASYLGAASAMVALDFASQRLDAWIAESIIYRIRSDLYRHMLALSPGSLGQHGTGDVLARLESDAVRAEALVYSGPSMILADLASSAVFAAVLFTISWPLTLTALVMLPPLALLMARYSPRIRRAARIARHRVSGLLALAEEKLNAGPIIHAFSTIEAEAARFDAACAATRTAELRTVAAEAWLNLMIGASMTLGGFLIAAAGAYEISRGALTLGDLAAFFGAISRLQGPVRGLAKASGRLQRGAAGARRVAELFDIRSVVTESPTAVPLVVRRGAVEFRDVSFGYGRGNGALLGLSLSIAPGETVAIVGPSGSGKSTLIQLLLRLHDPDSGSVLIDGIDIRAATLRSLRQSVAAVFQEPYLFRGSIADNIRYGAADPGRMAQAGRIACVESFACRSAEGWATPVGPHGEWLSGGQRQRIAFARALMRDAPILVLDEATASVDSETEELIHDAVAQLPRRTVLLVGHRLSSLRRADRVVVVEGGRVVESGTPAALLRRPDSRYHELFAAQLEARQQQ